MKVIILAFGILIIIAVSAVLFRILSVIVWKSGIFRPLTELILKIFAAIKKKQQ